MALHVAVVGAGIVGGSIAWRLAQRGCRVTLFDAGGMGGEASSAGAGMLAPGSEVSESSSWSDLALHSARIYPEFVRELAAESRETIDYRQGGAVEIASEEEERRDLARRVRGQPPLGIRSEPLTAAELMRMVPGLTAPEDAEARYFPDDAIVDPRDVMRALRGACLRRGVSVAESSPVSLIAWRSGGVRLDVANEGLVQADAVVLAAGAWSSEVSLLEEGGAVMPKPDAFPVRGHLLGYRLRPGTLAPILRQGHTYLLQRTPGLFIAGASAERVGFDRTINAAVVAKLQGQAEALFSPLRGLTPEPWVGFRPATASLEPEIRTVCGHDRVWIAYGHYRNGILLAPATAERVAAGIAG